MLALVRGGLVVLNVAVPRLVLVDAGLDASLGYGAGLEQASVYFKYSTSRGRRPAWLLKAPGFSVGGAQSGAPSFAALWLGSRYRGGLVVFAFKLALAAETVGADGPRRLLLVEHLAVSCGLAGPLPVTLPRLLAAEPDFVPRPFSPANPRAGNVVFGSALVGKDQDWRHMLGADRPLMLDRFVAHAPAVTQTWPGAPRGRD